MNGTVAFADGPPPGEGSDGEAAAAKGDISASQKPVEVIAEDLADEEWGPIKKEGKKGKKGKGKKEKVQDDSDDDTKLGDCRVHSYPSLLTGNHSSR